MGTTELMLGGLLAGLVLAGGLVGFVAGVVGTSAPRTLGPLGRFRSALHGSDQSAAARAQLRARWIVGGVLGLAAWAVTGWMVVGLLLVLLAVGLPWLLSPGKAATIRITELDALAEWTRRLADVLYLGVGLEQAMKDSRRTAPAALERPVGELAARLQSGWRPEDALIGFADHLNDATADKVCAALILRASDRGPGLARNLEDLADSVRDEVRQRREIEADRAKPRTTVRWMTFMTLAIIGAGSFDTAYIEPYGTVLGQLVLTMLIAGFAGVLAWMRQLATFRSTPRFLAADPRSSVTLTAPTPRQVADRRAAALAGGAR
ncbi:type II secretion system F family protein [Streptacidiphilus jiangxiensis]|uniref:Flp pilus assembly protein TadB n=1 Tax=Streptacidiphilus jiangxiensis TaxID=235985 RepID=A0A1H8BMS9_STRJI|nr:type II secretion system F family protein [Streptacidiphilus jiangxiensis]SEM83819.1 Flp pilus assembly protein TadB [Streptacidiphilus jiangxiensis]